MFVLRHNLVVFSWNLLIVYRLIDPKQTDKQPFKSWIFGENSYLKHTYLWMKKPTSNGRAAAVSDTKCSHDLANDYLKAFDLPFTLINWPCSWVNVGITLFLIDLCTKPTLGPFLGFGLFKILIWNIWGPHVLVLCV